jgi:hypothetical protein
MSATPKSEWAVVFGFVLPRCLKMYDRASMLENMAATALGVLTGPRDITHAVHVNIIMHSMGIQASQPTVFFTAYMGECMQLHVCDTDFWNNPNQIFVGMDISETEYINMSKTLVTLAGQNIRYNYSDLLLTQFPKSEAVNTMFVDVDCDNLSNIKSIYCSQLMAVVLKVGLDHTTHPELLQEISSCNSRSISPPLLATILRPYVWDVVDPEDLKVRNFIRWTRS